MDLIDIGANLGHESFDADLDAVLQRAVLAGVSQLVVTGASRAGSVRSLELARAHPGLPWATAGVHPPPPVEYPERAAAELRRPRDHPATPCHPYSCGGPPPYPTLVQPASGGTADVG